jgi:hypothetical protein
MYKKEEKRKSLMRKDYHETLLKCFRRKKEKLLTFSVSFFPFQNQDFENLLLE